MSRAHAAGRVARDVSAITRGACSVTRTKRRRFLWCAWWTGEPCESPFRPPDAWSGGARSLEEARASADTAAGLRLEPIDGHWAAGWVRVRGGLPPFAAQGEQARAPSGGSGRASGDRASSDGPYAQLGVMSGAPLDEVKSAFRRKALLHHPDRGGDSAT